MSNLKLPGLLAILLTLAACPSDKGDDTDASASATETTSASASMTDPTTTDTTGGATEAMTDPSTTTGGATEAMTDPSTTDTTGDETTGGPVHVDLFACNAPLACDQIFIHLDPEPPGALECAARLVVSPERGVILASESVGPDIADTDMIVLSQGDGTVLVQKRGRHCSFDLDPNCGADIPWEYTPHQICTPDIPPDLADACACGQDSCPGCSWNPLWDGVKDCQEVEDLTCEDLLAQLGG